MWSGFFIELYCRIWHESEPAIECNEKKNMSSKVINAHLIFVTSDTHKPSTPRGYKNQVQVTNTRTPADVSVYFCGGYAMLHIAGRPQMPTISWWCNTILNLHPVATCLAGRMRDPEVGQNEVAEQRHEMMTTLVHAELSGLVWCHLMMITHRADSEKGRLPFHDLDLSWHVWRFITPNNTLSCPQIASKLAS